MTLATADHIHRHEGRRLFGLNPAGYANARPDYPAWIFERLCTAGALAPGSATLEIGPGTGLATRHLLAHGANPLTLVEPDARFAEALGVAIAGFEPNCRFIHQSFEDAAFADHSFDLVACATAFHWIDPVPGLVKIANVLKPGGYAALFWNVLQDPAKSDAFHDATHHLLAPLSHGPAGAPNALPFALDRRARESEASAAGFTAVEYSESRWTLSLDTDRIGTLYESFSQIQKLERGARHRLLEQLKRIAATQFGGIVERNVTSCLYLLSR